MDEPVGSRDWRAGTVASTLDYGPGKSYREGLRDILFETGDVKGFDAKERVESIFEAIDGAYARPITLEEYEEELEGRESFRRARILPR